MTAQTHPPTLFQRAHSTQRVQTNKRTHQLYYISMDNIHLIYYNNVCVQSAVSRYVPNSHILVSPRYCVFIAMAPSGVFSAFFTEFCLLSTSNRTCGRRWPLFLLLFVFLGNCQNWLRESAVLVWANYGLFRVWKLGCKYVFT